MKTETKTFKHWNLALRYACAKKLWGKIIIVRENGEYVIKEKK